VARLEALAGSEINAAKIVLANEVSRLCRSAEAAQAAEATASATFTGGGVGEDLPVCMIPQEGFTIIDALTEIEFTASRGEAKRLVAGGGARLDGVVISDEAHRIEPDSGDLRLSAGDTFLRHTGKPLPVISCRFTQSLPFIFIVTHSKPDVKVSLWLWEQVPNYPLPTCGAQRGIRLITE
jgi:hypothetical protein